MPKDLFPPTAESLEAAREWLFRSGCCEESKTGTFDTENAPTIESLAKLLDSTRNGGWHAGRAALIDGWLEHDGGVVEDVKEAFSLTTLSEAGQLWTDAQKLKEARGKKTI